MKKIILICVAFISLLWITMFLASCTPVRYVYVSPQDSVVRKQRIIYDYQYAPIQFTPIIIQRWIVPRYQPQRWTPQRPYYRPTPFRQLPPRPSRKN
jgi:hypothetical protein